MRKLFVMFLSGLLILTSVPVNSYAATQVSAKATVSKDAKITSTDPTSDSLKSAILAVKGKITIPEDYTQFNYNFNDSTNYTEAYWSLTWSKPDSNGSIIVNCDSNNHIIYYNKYDDSKSATGIAKYLKSELKDTALKFITQIAPETKDCLKLTDSGYLNTYSSNYYYTFQRVNNGVDFPDNTAVVNVNSISGEVTMASISWLYDTQIPDSKAKLTKDEATALIKKNLKMKLVYRTNYSNIVYDKTGNDSNTQNAFLVYEPSQDYISIDAKSGEVYNTKSQWANANSANGSGNSLMETMKSSGDSSTTELTEDELAKVKELGNLISKSKAIKLVTGNSSLYIDKNLTKCTATLDKYNDGNGDNSYVWYVSLSDPREVTDTSSYTYRGYAWATVDALTGKIKSFYSSMNNYYDYAKQKWNTVKIKYNKDECKGFLETFFKSQMKDYFKNSVLSTTQEDYIAYYDAKQQPVYGGYAYQYNRVNEGIEFMDNYITGSVDGVTGKIYSFGSNWNKNVTFQTSKGAITADQAMDYYLNNEGYGLKYEISQINKPDSESNNGTYSVEYKVRLVYRPDISPAYISPFTGGQLNANGEVYKETKPYTYKDIDNSQLNRNILLLADMNIGFDGDNFLPNQNITLGEIKTLLSYVGYTTTEGDDKKLITKEELAGLFINWLGLEKLSKLKIYSTGYNDENQIDSQYVGAVALAKGLGIITGDSYNNFNPKKNITRYEAVNYIMGFIAAQQDGVNNY